MVMGNKTISWDERGEEVKQASGRGSGWVTLMGN
jgi:hypothetical protein